MTGTTTQPRRSNRDGSPPDPLAAVEAFIADMKRAGVHPQDRSRLASLLLEQRGKLVRFRAEGDTRPNGWAVLHLDRGAAGSFGHWRLGLAGRTWHLNGPRPSQSELVRLRAEREAQAAEFAWKALDRQHGAAFVASELWEGAWRRGMHRHPYALRKRLDGAGTRWRGDRLLIPMRDPSGRLLNVQTIPADGRRKLFLKGARVKGVGWRHGDGKGPLCIGEGWATMAAVHAATGLPVLAAMSAQNLIPAAEAWREAEPDRLLIFCADMDPSGAGERAAESAALATGGLLALPPRPPGWPDGHKWDFADLWTVPGGAAAIRAALILHRGDDHDQA